MPLGRDVVNLAATEAPAPPSVRPGALTELLAELARVPEAGAGWEVPLLAGDEVGRFEVIREIGRGGFGVVYEAKDHELGRMVAFKAVRAAGVDRVREARTLGEAEAAARLAHPNIVHLYDVGRCEQGAYLIMELLRGETLAARLARGSPPLREALRVAVDVSRGVAHAHDHGVVHRDLKPGNVFVCDDGQVKVLDFGLAHVFGRAGLPGGTPGYMAPEQARGEMGDERSDVFSLGAMLRELVPAPPPALARLAARMVAEDPAARPSNAQDVHAALLAIQRSLEPRWRFWVAWSVAAVALVAAAAFGLRSHPLPPGRLLVAMADTDNTTGDPDLDGASELLGMGLEQTKRVSLIARSRIVNLLREAGSAVPRVIGEPEARNAARSAQAQVLVLPAVRRNGSGYDVDVRAVDLARDQPLLVAREPAAAKSTIPAALDRLVHRVREGLHEDPRDAPKVAVSTAEIAPANPESLRLYTEGKRLLSTGRFEEARKAFAAAVAADPEFLLARVELLDGEASQRLPITRRERDEHRRVLRRDLHRLPAKERTYAEFLLGEFGNLTEWLEALDRAIEAWPEDPRPYVLASAVLLDLRGDLHAARPYVEKAHAIAPLESGEVIDHLIALDRLDDALARARRWTSEQPSRLSFMNLSEVYRARGELSEALEAARRGTNVRTFVDADALEEGEALLAANKGNERGVYDGWVRWLTLRGRIGEAVAAMTSRAPPADAPPGARNWFLRWRAFVLATRDGPEPIRSASLETFRAGFLPDPCTFWPLALAGDPERAAMIATKPIGSLLGGQFDHHLCPRLIAAIATWKRGDREAALTALARIHVAASDLYRGEILWELGRDREAIDAIRAYRRRRGATDWDINLDPWHYPRSLYVEAQALERLGEEGEALKAVNRLLHVWERADPAIPLLPKAKALRERLVAATRGM